MIAGMQFTVWPGQHTRPSPYSLPPSHLSTWCGGVLEIFMPMTPLAGDVSGGGAERCACNIPCAH